VIYVNTWASWSPLSRDELIALNEVAGEFKDKPITFIALNRREPVSQAQAYLATLPPLPNLTIVIDSTDEFYKEVTGYAMPETVLYTKDGAIWRHERQPLTAEVIRTLANELLAVD
jgi:thiol-disulfide isomerase/thioredoxin